MDWQPIATAKRGPAIVWSKSKGLIKDAMLYGNNGYAVYGSYYHQPVYDVTHWMPDPTSPEDRQP